MPDYPPATIATRRRAAGRALLKTANSLPIEKREYIAPGDWEFLSKQEAAYIQKMMAAMDSIRINATKLGAKLAATTEAE